jgi:hypothetical protein
VDALSVDLRIILSIFRPIKDIILDNNMVVLRLLELNSMCAAEMIVALQGK